VFEVSTTGIRACLQWLCKVLDGLVNWLLRQVVPYQLSHVSVQRSSSASAAVYYTPPAWLPKHDSPVDSNLVNLAATGPSQWSLGSSPADTLAQTVLAT
jgi:hypothetical protein